MRNKQTGSNNTNWLNLFLNADKFISVYASEYLKARRQPPPPPHIIKGTRRQDTSVRTYGRCGLNAFISLIPPTNYKVRSAAYTMKKKKKSAPYKKLQGGCELGAAFLTAIRNGSAPFH